MAADGMKWRVNRAVRASTLPAPSRLIMLTLSDIAHAGTAELPPERTPSTAQLAFETGLSETTVKTHRAALEEAGWIAVIRPTAAEAARRVRCKYRLAIPDGFTPRSRRTTPSTPERGQEPTQQAPSTPDPVNTRTPSAPDPQRGQLPTPSGVSSRPPNNYNHDQDNQTPAARPVADELTDAFWNRHRHRMAQPYTAVRGIIRTAIANGAARDDVARALERLVLDGRPITGAGLTAALALIRQAAPSTPRAPAARCPIHSIELSEAGTCRGCAADAKAAPAQDTDLDQRPPTATRAGRAPAAAPGDDVIAELDAWDLAHKQLLAEGHTAPTHEQIQARVDANAHHHTNEEHP